MKKSHVEYSNSKFKNLIYKFLFIFVLIICSTITCQAQANRVYYSQYRNLPKDSTELNILFNCRLKSSEAIKSDVENLLNKYKSKEQDELYMLLSSEFAVSYFLGGNYPEFYKVLLSSSEKCKNLNSSNIEKIINVYYQSLFHRMNVDYEKSIYYLDSAFILSQKTDYSNVTNGILTELITINLRIQNFSKAFQYFEYAQKDAKETGDTIRLAELYTNVAYEIRKIDPALSLSYLKKAENYYNLMIDKDPLKYSYYLGVVSRVNVKMKDYKAVKKASSLKLNFMEENPNVLFSKASYTEAFTDLYTANFESHNFVEAKNYAVKNTRFIESLSLENSSIYTQGLRLLGRCYTKLQQNDSAEYSFNKSLSISEKLNNNKHIKSNYLTYCYLGELYGKQHYYNKSRVAYVSALQCLIPECYDSLSNKFIFQDVEKISNKEDAYITFDAFNEILYLYFIESGDKDLLYQIIENTNYAYKLINANYKVAINEKIALNYSNTVKNNSHYGILAAEKLANEFNEKNFIDTAIFFVEQSRLFHFRNKKNISRTMKNTPDSLKQKYAQLQDLILQKEVSLNNNLEITDELFDLKNELFLLKMKLNSYLNNIDTEVTSTYNYLANCKRDQAYLSYTILKDYFVTVGFNSDKKKIIISKADELNSEANTFLRAIKSGSSFAKEGQELGEYLLYPLREIIKGKRQLIIVPDGVLFKVPFEALTYENKSVISQCSVSYKYKLKTANKKYSNQQANYSLLAVSPFIDEEDKFDENIKQRLRTYYKNTEHKNLKLPALYSSKSEVLDIGKMFKKEGYDVDVRIGSKAVKKELESSLKTSSVLHFATHGISTNDVYTSGLFFYDSEKRVTSSSSLMLYELYTKSFNADLVVLSACSTGKGKILEGEGVMALPRGFIYAGVPNVIASLWKVHDERTKDLMVAFYKHLLEDKVGYAEALRLAKLDCIEKGFLPLDWAGFILIGE